MFFDVGKMSVLNILRAKPNRSINLVALTQEDIDSSEVAARVFLTALYDSKNLRFKYAETSVDYKLR